MDIETKVTLDNIKKLLPAGFVIIPANKPEIVESPQWNLKELCRYMQRREDWVRRKFLMPHRRFLEDANGGPVHYSTGSGSPWRINAAEIKKYIETHYDDIY